MGNSGESQSLGVPHTFVGFTFRNPPDSHSEDPKKIPESSDKIREGIIIVKHSQNFITKSYNPGKRKLLPEAHPS